MRSFWPCLVVVLTGLALAAGAAVALAAPPARGGHAVAPKTRNAPHPPEQVWGGSSSVPAPAVLSVGQIWP